jgi:uncharacterized protein CbrC (UPF0167 family)
MKRGLGIQGPEVLARTRRAPGVLSSATGGAAADASRRAGAARQRVARLMRELTAAREDLDEALAGWELADPDAAERVSAIRQRHGIAAGTSDLTTGSGKS